MATNSNSVGQVQLDLTLNKKGFEKDVNKTLKTTESAFSHSFGKIGTVIATAFSVKAVVDFGRSAVQAASDAQAAWTGLNSIVQGTGNSFGVAKKFLTEFTKDGLVGIEDAATAYKNLLARGYDTTQIENVMTRLKDSAAFGRQSSYTLSQAVVSATEGLKNENSILVDNAGVTKNVAKMWEEYADSIGKTANNLTQQEKIQAEVNGIMKETAFQAGDAATYTNTFAGRVQVLKGAFSSMKTAIGKVIAPIVSLFIPAITSAINAVTAFFNRLQAVLSVFGLEFPDVVSKTSSGIANIGDSASATANNIAGTGDAATKAAKKIKKAFAGVDEINVLSKPDSGSSSGGGGSDGIGDIGGIGGGAVDTGTDPVSSAVKSTAEKIMKYLAPLKEISFDNLINAFNRLKESLAPLGETIWRGLEWAYFNILVPLAEWTIEDLLPAFFNLLSGALDVLNPILSDAMSLLEWLWDKFLQPVASWTGGVIVDVLNGIGDALSWIGKNEIAVSIIEGFAISLGLVTGALKLWNAAVVVWNSAGAIASAVTTAFGVAMGVLTSPVTLVVAAIAALVAGIILLIKNWDTVKEVAANCWAKIKEIWNKVATWFSDNVIKPIAKYFSDLWTKIKNVFSPVATWLKDKFKTAWNNVKSAWNSATSWFGSVWSGIKSKFSSVATWFKDTFKKAWNNIKSVFSGVGSYFGGIWNTIKSKFTNIGQKIGDSVGGAFKSAVNSLLKNAEKVLNAPIGAINKAIEVLNKAPGVNIGKLSTFSLPRLAQGGWVGANNPQLAIIGDNKREGEIVSPESKIYAQTRKAVEDAGGTNTSQHIDFTIKLEYPDGRYLIKEINDAQIRDGRLSLLV